MSVSHGGAQAAPSTAGTRASGRSLSFPFAHSPIGLRIGFASPRLVVAAALAGMLVVGAAGPASAHHPDVTTEEGGSPVMYAGAGLRPGDLVTDNGISVVVPERGETIWAELKFDDGTYQTLSVETERNGSVRLLQWGDEAGAGPDAGLSGATALAASASPTSGMTAAQPDGGSGSKGECSDGSYNRFSFRMPHLKWRYASGTTPSKFRNRTNGTRQVIDALKRANRNITGARNVCGRSDYIGAQGTYLGTTSRRPNVSSSGSCTGRDGYSVIGWGSLPANSIALACIMGISGGVASEGDIRINWNKAYESKRRYCSGELLIEAAMTHEFGHLYGMAHVSSYSSPNLTMQPIVSYCSMAHTTLGLGDMRGLETKY